MVKLFSAKFASATRALKDELPETLWERLSRWHPVWATTHIEPPYLEHELSPGQSGCKADVDLGGLKPIMYVLWVEMVDIYNEIGSPCIITSALDGKHSSRSLHYEGRALDFRTRMLTAKQHQTLIQKTKRRMRKLAEDFNSGAQGKNIRVDVVPEATHLHLEVEYI